MSKIKCPVCGYTEDDARPHDRETYFETCVSCERKVVAAFTPPDPFSRKV